jgi:hypothetical protein
MRSRITWRVFIDYIFTSLTLHCFLHGKWHVSASSITSVAQRYRLHRIVDPPFSKRLLSHFLARQDMCIVYFRPFKKKYATKTAASMTMITATVITAHITRHFLLSLYCWTSHSSLLSRISYAAFHKPRPLSNCRRLRHTRFSHLLC